MNTRESNRRLGPLFAVGSVILFGVASWFLWPRFVVWSAERRAREELRNVAECTSLRATTTHDDLRSAVISAQLSGVAWGTECSVAINALSAAARRAWQVLPRCDGGCCPHDERCQDFRSLEDAAVALKILVSDHVLVDDPAARTVAVAASLGWGLPTPSTAPPPVTTGHLRVGDVPQLAAQRLGRTALCRTPKPAWWLLLHDEERGAALCALGLPEPTGRCHALPATVPTRGDLYLVDGGLAAAPRLTAGVDGAWNMFGPSGQPISELPTDTVGATALASGAPATLVAKRDGYAVIVDGEERFVVEATATPLLYGGYALVQNSAQIEAYFLDNGERHILGSLPGEARVTMRGCVGSNITAVRMRDDVGGSDVIAVVADGKWSLLDLPEGIPPSTLSCHQDSAHLTWIETVRAGDAPGKHVGTYRVHDVVCRSGCEQRRGELTLERRTVQSRFFVASLGGDVAVLWRTPLGDVRAVVARPDEVGDRTPIPVMEDAEHGGFAWDTAPLRVMSAERAAVILLEHEEGVRGALLDHRGARAITVPRL